MFLQDPGAGILSTSWNGGRVMHQVAGALPGAPGCSGSDRVCCQTLLHRQLVQRCGWSSRPSKGTASLACAMASNLAIADRCSTLDRPAINPDHGIAFCPGMDMAWKAQQNCSVPVTAQPRAGDVTPKEGPKAAGHSLLSGGKPGPCPIPSNPLQVLSGGLSRLWIFSVLVTTATGRLQPLQRFQQVGKYHLSLWCRSWAQCLEQGDLRKCEIAAGCVTTAVDAGQ